MGCSRALKDRMQQAMKDGSKQEDGKQDGTIDGVGCSMHLVDTSTTIAAEVENMVRQRGSLSIVAAEYDSAVQDTGG